MPAVRPSVVAIACADLHFSLKPPVARAGEKDWLAAQDRQLGQLRELQEEHDLAPVLCAGDVFDRWNSPPALINWLIPKLPKRIWAIPGQHDLPNHNLSQMTESAYWTLVEAGKINDLSFNDVRFDKKWYVTGFPWGCPLKPPSRKGGMQVALVHAYTWIRGAEYPGAPNEARLCNMEGLEGWDVVVFGDNHKGFRTKHKLTNTVVFNCGTFQRRKSDEIKYKPQVGLIYSDGTVEPYLLDCSNDIIQATVSEKEHKENIELQDFLEELLQLQETELDFEEAMKQVFETQKPSARVKQMILEAMS